MTIIIITVNVNRILRKVMNKLIYNLMYISSKICASFFEITGVFMWLSNNIKIYYYYFLYVYFILKVFLMFGLKQKPNFSLVLIVVCWIIFQDFLGNFNKMQLSKCNFKFREYPRALVYFEEHVNKFPDEMTNSLSFLAQVRSLLFNLKSVNSFLCVI